jgi:hypothetical protein
VLEGLWNSGVVLSWPPLSFWLFLGRTNVHVSCLREMVLFSLYYVFYGHNIAMLGVLLRVFFVRERS